MELTKFLFSLKIPNMKGVSTQVASKERKREKTQSASREATPARSTKEARNEHTVVGKRLARCVIRDDKKLNHSNDWGSNWSVRHHRFRKATTPVVQASSKVQDASHSSVELARTTGQERIPAREVKSNVARR